MFSDLFKVETVASDFTPTHRRAISVSEPANDNAPRQRLRAKVLVPDDLPITQAEIEVFALLLDDAVHLAANDNEETSE
jgi:hypothetical protein